MLAVAVEALLLADLLAQVEVAVRQMALLQIQKQRQALLLTRDQVQAVEVFKLRTLEELLETQHQV
jgi:hypothetical protein